jgi:hypothetical protein
MNEFTSSTTTTTEFVAPPDKTGINIELRIPQGWWIGLVLLVPCLAIFSVWAVWFYGRLKRWYQPSAEGELEENTDKFGVFNIVRNQRDSHHKARRGQMIIIVVEDLPNIRPLGLELVETKVMRVHPRGARYGWHVGDVIVEIAGVQVNTFEDIWKRIQIERDRCPVKFVAERFDFSEAAGKPVTPDNMMGMIRRGGQSKAKVSADPAATGTGSAALGTGSGPLSADQGPDSGGNTLKGAVVGWEAWAVAKAPEELVQTAETMETELQKGLKAAFTTRQQEEAQRRNMAEERRAAASQARKMFTDPEDAPRPGTAETIESTGSMSKAQELALERLRDQVEDAQNNQEILDLLKGNQHSDEVKLPSASDLVALDEAPKKKDQKMTLEEEMEMANRVAKIFHRPRNTPHAKQAKEEVRFFRDGWGRQLRQYV